MKVFGLASEEAKNSFNPPLEGDWYFVSYADQEVKINESFTDENGTKYKVLAVTQQFGHQYDYIPMGWKTLSKLETDKKDFEIYNSWGEEYKQ